MSNDKANNLNLWQNKRTGANTKKKNTDKNRGWVLRLAASYDKQIRFALRIRCR